MQGAMKRQVDKGELSKGDRERLLAQVSMCGWTDKGRESRVGGWRGGCWLIYGRHIYVRAGTFTHMYTHIDCHNNKSSKKMDGKLASLKEELAAATAEKTYLSLFSLSLLIPHTLRTRGLRARCVIGKVNSSSNQSYTSNSKTKYISGLEGPPPVRIHPWH